MKNPALNRGLTSEGGPLSGVGEGEGEGEVSEETNELNLGEFDLGRDFLTLGPCFLFPTPACPPAESAVSFPSPSPSASPSSSPTQPFHEPPPHSDPFPTHIHWLHHQYRRHGTDRLMYLAVGISDG